MYFFQVNNLKTKKSLFYDKYNIFLYYLYGKLFLVPLNVYSTHKRQGFSCDLALWSSALFVPGTENLAILGLWQGLGRNRNPGEPLDAHVGKKKKTKKIEKMILVTIVFDTVRS